MPEPITTDLQPDEFVDSQWGRIRAAAWVQLERQRRRAKGDLCIEIHHNVRTGAISLIRTVRVQSPRG